VRSPKPRKNASKPLHRSDKESEGGRDEPLKWGASPQRKNPKPDFVDDIDACRSRRTREHRQSGPWNARPSNPVESIFAGRDHAGTSKPSPNASTAIRALFSAAKVLLCPKDEPKPQARRRRGETGKDGFALAWRRMLRRAARADPVARGRYAGLRAEGARTRADVYASVAMYLSDTLDWLNLWQDNGNNENWLDDEFSAKLNQNFPQF
jgi:hypothetical protein